MKKYAIPAVMGIINVTDDSFFASSRMSSVALAVKKAGEMLNDGASILDIGGCSTRPGCKVVDAETEKERVIPAIKAISEHFPGTEISVDTFRS